MMKIKTDPNKKFNIKLRLPKGMAEKMDFNKMNIGVFAGLLGGAGGTMGFGYLHDKIAERDDSDDEGPIEEAEPIPDTEMVEYEIPTSVEFSQTVSDDMSFADAFQAARKELGQGGFFTWKGQHFHTYTEEEWNSFSEEDKNRFFEVFRENTDFNQGRETDDNSSPDADGDEVEPEPKSDKEDKRKGKEEGREEEDNDSEELVDLEEFGSDEEIIDGMNDGEAYAEEDNFGEDVT